MPTDDMEWSIPSMTPEKLLSRNRAAVSALADELLQVESVDADGVKAIIAGGGLSAVARVDVA